MKKCISIVLCLLVTFFCYSIGVEAASYSNDYRTWSQGASDYSFVKDKGCFVVAQAKLLYESGINTSNTFNPDVLYEFLYNYGYSLGPDLSVNYASHLGKKLTLLENTVTSNTDIIWKNINDGYFTLLFVYKSDVPSHFIMISNNLSKENGELYCYNSWTGYSSVSPMSLKSTGYTIGRIYTYSVESNPSHTHNYTIYEYEAAHPHKYYKKCSCGDYYYTGETAEVSDCSDCNQISNVSIYADYSKDTITDTNAILWGRVDKPSSHAVTKIGIKVRQEGSSYENGWSRYDTPSSSYTGYTYMYPYYDMNAELGVTLTHATTYYYQFYAMVDGTEYWSAENTFTTTGSHSYPSNWTTITNATCTSEGSSQRSCTGCGKTETQTIPALGHNYASYWTTDEEATCTTSGSKSHHCYNCSSKSDVTVIPATGHSYGEWIVEREASIRYNGINKHYCRNCNASETLYLPTLSYKLGDYNLDNLVNTVDLANFKIELTLLSLLEKEYGDSDIAIFEDESLTTSTNDLFIVCDINEDEDVNTVDLACLKLTLAGMMDVENRGGTLIIPDI